MPINIEQVNCRSYRTPSNSSCLFCMPELGSSIGMGSGKILLVAQLRGWPSLLALSVTPKCCGESGVFRSHCTLHAIVDNRYRSSAHLPVAHLTRAHPTTNAQSPHHRTHPRLGNARILPTGTRLLPSVSRPHSYDSPFTRVIHL